MSNGNLNADFARFCLIVEFWLLTESKVDAQADCVSRIKEVRKRPCAISGCCSEPYVRAILNLLREFPDWQPIMEQKALVGSGFAHLYNADGYR